MIQSMRDRVSERWAIAILAVVACLLVSMLVRAEASLEERARAWVMGRPDGPWRMRQRGAEADLRAVVAAARAAAREWPDAELLLALAWRESAWRPGARGALGERGLAQVMPGPWVPRAVRRRLSEPDVNLAHAARVLAEGHVICGGPGPALVRYATSRCGRPGWAERIVLRWAEAMR